MSLSNTPMTLGNRKLVVLGVPWDVDTDGLRQYMSKYGELADVIVMKDRTTGRSRGFGYVTFSNTDDAEKAMATQHLLNGRMLEVKVATPKEDMRPPPGKKSARIFVARIPASVTDEMFRSYFEKYGTITDAYMPKDQGSRAHRGIGFVTYEDPESVDKLMTETHELAGSTIAVDRATPKEETGRYWDKLFPASYGAYNSYMNAARFGFFGMPPFFPFEYPGPGFPTDMGGAGMGAPPFGAANMWQPPTQVPSSKMTAEPTGTGAAISNHGFNHASHASAGPPAAPKAMGKKIFIGRISMEATADDVRLYFSRFGRLLDVYLPKDRNKTTHRGFGFVTFAEESSAERVASRSHDLLGQTLAIDRASPIEETPHSGAFYNTSSSAVSSGTVGAGGPIRGGSNTPAAGYGSLSTGSYDYTNPWGSFDSGAGSIAAVDPRASRMETRYRPY